jgi:hypothetical protein
MLHPEAAPLTTPIYLKTRDDMPWPEEEVFYLLANNGLFLCRNHPFFQSSVPARRCPSELAEHAPTLHLRYPKLPRWLLEVTVGFFARVAHLHNAEAAVLLAWDNTANRPRLLVPEQTATVGTGWRGDTYPIGVHYETPAELPPGWTLIGDIHSHVEESAYASATDRHDETHRPGLHIVVGRISREPPDVHVEAVVDGTRFHVDPSFVLDTYRRRKGRVPPAWLQKVKIKRTGGWSTGSYSGWGYGNGWNSGYANPYGGLSSYPAPHDRDAGQTDRKPDDAFPDKGEKS